MSGCFTMDVAYIRFFTGAPTTFTADVSAMSDSSFTNGECLDRHGPKTEDRRLLLNAFTCKMSGNLDSMWNLDGVYKHSN